MKKLAIVLAVAGVLSACSSTKDTYVQRASQDFERQERAALQAIEKAPDWMSKLPKSSSAVYENGTAVSSDFAMADMKAKTIAYAKICTAAGGKVRSQTKVFRSDSDSTSTEASEMAIRNICPDIDVTGVETVETKHVAEGGRIRTYVLVALPIGSANTLRKEADARDERRIALDRAPHAFKEVDDLAKGKTPEVKTQQNETFKLMDVENEEYKQKRSEAIQKPGAVVGQAVVR